MSICIIGGGVAGTLVCLELIRKGTKPESITIIDPYFDGGALSRTWGAIYSNTRWEQITESMKVYPTTQPTIDELNKIYSPESRVLLHHLGWLIQESLQNYLPNLNLIVDICDTLQQTDNGWEIQAGRQRYSFKTVILCQGGRAKSLDFGKRVIPLEVALDPARIGRLVRSHQSVAVFGLSHSGTIICKHLLDIGAKVYGVHKSEKPFLFNRDGEYDGIKQESAEIADRLIQAPASRFEFIQYQDTPKLVKILSKVHWIVSAIGFEGSPIQIHMKEGSQLSSATYSSETAELAPSLYGFGLAYPGVTVVNTKIHKDVSIPSFITQIQRCLPAI